MKKIFPLYILLMVLLLAGLAQAKSDPNAVYSEPLITDQGGPDAYGYSWIDNDSAGGPTYNWVDITTRGTQVIGLADDNNIGPIQIGFEFPYYWYTVNRCWIGSNGYIEFLEGYNYAHPFANIPTSARPNDYLACLTGDLDFTRGNGTCYYYTNNVDSFVVSWINVSEYQPDVNLIDSVHTFQLILTRNDSSITYQYGVQHGNFSGGSNNDLVGIENVNGQVGIQYLRSQVPTNHLVHDGLALKFHPVPNPNFVVHDAGMLNAFQDGSGANFIANAQGYTIRAQVKDFGNQPESGDSVICTIKRGTTTVYADTIPVPAMNPSETAWLNFPDLFTPSQVASYNCIFRSKMTGDQNRANDTLYAELDAYVLPQTIRYDDGVGENTRSWTGDFSGFAQEFQMPEPIKLDSVMCNIGAVTAPGDCYIWILPDDGTGRPNQAGALAGDTVNVTLPGWVTLDVSALNLTFLANEKFWVVEVHALQSTLAFGVDQTRPLSNRGWEFTGGYAPDRDRIVSDLMIDAYVEAFAPPPGTLTGTITDAALAPLAGVVDSVFTMADVFVNTVTTGADGIYTFGLNAGSYKMKLVKDGYRDTTISNIVVDPGGTTTLNVQMTVENISLCDYTPGDINGNNIPNGIDVVFGVNYFKGVSTPPINCSPFCPNQPAPFYAAGDVNGNCAFNGIDITFFVRYLKGQVPALLFCPDCPPLP